MQTLTPRQKNTKRTEVVVELDTRWRTSLWLIVAATAAVPGVGLITIEIGKAGAFTALNLTRRIFRTREFGRAFRIRVCRARCGVTISTGLDFHWEVETIDQGY